MTKKTGNRFGEIAVREGFASRNAVRECLEIQGKLKSFGVEPKRLGEIMVEKGYLRDEDVRAILDVQRLGGSRMDSRSGVAEQRQRSRNTRATGVSKVLGGGSPGRPSVRSIPGYEVLELLGEGGMGMVYKARQKSLDRIVALKILPPSAAKEASFIKRFISEARTVARLNHENIIAGIDVGEADGTYYFAMEHVEGESVAELIERAGPVEERFALTVTLHMARALEHAHKHGLVHRDVKPQNILVTKNKLAKLCDLGLAKMQNEGGAGEAAGVPVGTPHYLSPEQARGEADVDIRSDIYSLGATLFHMLTGNTPFDGQSPMVLMTKHLTEEPEPAKRLNPNVSRGASDLVTVMMSKDKEDRQQTPSELAEDLEKVLSGKRAGASGRSKSGSGKSRRRRRSGRSGGAAGAPPGPSKRPRAPRGRVVRSGGSGETGFLLVVPFVILLLIGAVVFMSYQGPTLGPAPVQPKRDKKSEDEARAALKAANALRKEDPSKAKRQLQAVITKFPGTTSARNAKRYLEELGG